MKVVIAFIENAQQQILIARRPWHVDCPGLWEFPGGKIEAHETSLAALERELNEELGIQEIEAQFLTIMNLNHEFHLYRVTGYQGEVKAHEAQLAMNWVAVQDLNKYEFPENNWRFIEVYQCRY